MEVLTENHQNIKELAMKRYNYEDKDLFFEKSFPNYSVFDQATILEEFQKNFPMFLRYINGSLDKEKLEIVFKNAVSSFVNKSIDYDDASLFPILLTYFNMDYVPFDEKLYSGVFQKMEELYRHMDLGKIPYFEEVLSTYIKNIVYASGDSKEYHFMTRSGGYPSFEKIVCQYVESMSDEKAIESDFLQLLVEASPQLPTSNILDTVRSKMKKEISFQKYQKYIESKEEVPVEEEQEFINCVRGYRLQNGVLPLDICYYINHVYDSYDDLLRLCNIDLIKHYLHERHIDDVAILYDENISRFNSRGIALSTALAIKDVSLSPVMFHEATHLMQYRNFARGIDFSGNYYDMLKDYVLKDYLAPVVYNRNLNRYLFEIEADYCGELEYYRILEQLGNLTEKDLSKRERLEDNEIFRFSLAHFLNIDGEDFEKGQLFDSIVAEHPEIIMKYPIFNVEYHPDGSRKGVIQILESLDREAMTRNEYEISAIANCIFGEYYVVDDAVEMLSSLKQYVPNHTAILETEKRIINELLAFLQSRDHIREEGPAKK